MSRVIEYVKSEHGVIKRRTFRWVLSIFMIGISPVIVTFCIKYFVLGANVFLLDTIKNCLRDGTFIILAITIQGAKYVDFTYARDYDKLNNYESSLISIPFLLSVILGVLLYTFIQTIELLVDKNTYQKIVTNNSITYLSLIILICSIIHTAWMHHFALKYQRKEGKLHLPTVDNKL